MRLLTIRTITGPNVYSYRPMLQARIDLEDYADRPSNSFPGFCSRLLSLLPGLHKHHCSKGYEGGFLERLNSGTYLAHIVEHVALELSGLAGMEVTHGKTVSHKPPRVYNVLVRFKSEAGMRYLLQQAFALVEAAIAGADFDVQHVLTEAKVIAEDGELGPSTRSIADAAQRSGIPWRRLNEANLLQLGYGKNRKLVQAAMTSNSSAIAMELAGDKELTKSVLRSSGLPVPAGQVVTSREAAVEFAWQTGAPVAIKPLDGNQGKGITLNVVGDENVGNAFDYAAQRSRRVIVEEMLEGRDYRVLVVNYKVVAASERVAAHVVGDGVHTIAELVAAENQNPLRGAGHEKPLTKLRIDAGAICTLQQCGLSPDSVPAAGQRVFLRGTANLSTGGIATDVTDRIHPDNVTAFEHAARVIGLDICGLDVITPDISEPIRKRGGGIIEANAAPGLRMHVHPSAGSPRDVGAAIVNMLFPEPESARIPIVSITGTNGKTTVTRLLAHILQTKCCTVGMTTTDGIWVGGKQIGFGDTTGPRSAETVLSDPAVEMAVLETARGGIIRSGLGYDWSDIGILTNVQEDHLGQDGIENVDDILHIKSLVAERVREGGTVILNADDPALVRLPEHRRMQDVARSIVFVSGRDHNPHVTQHLKKGGTAFFVSHGRLVEASGNQLTFVCDVADVPFTIGGTAEFQVYNLMFAIAAARTLGLDHSEIVAAAQSFRSSVHNPGRANLFQVDNAYVLVDYGHNPAALTAIAGMTAQWHSVCVTGVLTMPGDRSDDLIKHGGRVAGHGFDKIIVREDGDRRGRRSGAIAELLCAAIQEAHPDIKLAVELDERRSYERALDELKPGEVAVLFYDDFEIVSQVLAARGARPVAAPESLMQQFATRGKRIA
jgi:cyanophycin synthetase